MKLDDYSLAFNCPGYPSWGTAIVNQDKGLVHLIKEDVAKDIIIGMVHKLVPINTHDFSMPIGKGSRIYFGDTGFADATSEPILLALFDKVFIDNTQIPAPFLMAIIKDKAEDHKGRLQIKYQPKMYYGASSNLAFFEKAREVLGLNEDTPWLFQTIDVVNQEELHFTSIHASTPEEVEAIRRSGQNTPIPSANDLKEAFREYLFAPNRFDDANTASKYWKVITSDREEIQFLKEIISDVTEGRETELFSISNESEAERIWEKTKPDPRNQAFQRSIISAILGKYKEFLHTFNRIGAAAKTRVDIPQQVLYYGAPGTGKSFYVEEKVIMNQPHYRVTFHPDTDYASFVGCYKPETIDDVVNGVKQSKIGYGFHKQVFLEAYVDAWAHLKDGKKVYLVIEEINRGNCAQIFGDIFQLLDRRKDGFSKYTINADKDIERILVGEIPNYKSLFLNAYPNKTTDWSDNLMALPSNLYIIATMNTSDQSLFPMDSAFKRRWDTKYFPIDYVDANGATLSLSSSDNYPWGTVLQILNDYIKKETESANKAIGNRFIDFERTGNTIDYKTFRDKVLFFLFSDVFKDNVDFAKFFFGDKFEKPYMFFEDLCEHEDVGIVRKFIKKLDVNNKLNIVLSNQDQDETESSEVSE